MVFHQKILKKMKKKISKIFFGKDEKNVYFTPKNYGSEFNHSYNASEWSLGHGRPMYRCDLFTYKKIGNSKFLQCYQQ